MPTLAPVTSAVLFLSCKSMMPFLMNFINGHYFTLAREAQRQLGDRGVTNDSIFFFMSSPTKVTL
jgi:hypothetical protein